MTPLADHLAARIRAEGPMTVAAYMADCLLHPTMGYYTTQTPFGAAGDFTTAPEISQMFGELIGLCLAQAWLDQGAPAAFTLAELGPGRGTLMADVLRATRGVPGFHAAAGLVLVEASPRLRAVQASALAPYRVAWADDSAALPDDVPLFLIANEFFDALPIRQFVKDAGGWRERLVGLVQDTLTFGLSEAQPSDALDAQFPHDEPGTLVEICPQASGHINEIAQRIANHGGAALIVDYGGWQSKGDTLQAVIAHRFSPPLEQPGRADLTAHVDFQALATAATPLRAAYTAQGAFLTALGIETRAAQLVQHLSGAALENHRAAHHRLTDGTEMGSLFKVLGLTRPDAPLLPGFA